MAGGQKLLIDTNVLIGLEDWRETNPTLAKLQKLSSQYGHRMFVHQAAVSDIQRDRDVDRRRVTLSKIEKFERLSGIPVQSRDDLEKRFGRITSPNDQVDVDLLYALELGAADFLITEDQGIHSRARRVSPEFSDRVLTIVEAVDWLVAEHEPRSVRLPLIEELPAHAIPLTDALFDSLREGYDGFDRWWKDRCVAEHRPCWVVSIANQMAGIVVRKDEWAGPRKILKLCTFKVSPEFRGEKLGELLLKQALWFAQRNDYHSVYLTTFPEQTVLISVLEYYGFMTSGPLPNGELRLEKHLSRERLRPQPDVEPFVQARMNYPRFVSPPDAEFFCIPIRGEYHDMLFPELEDRKQTDLFEVMGLPGARSRKPGNTIRKVYLCRASTNQLAPGSVIAFYRSLSRSSHSSWAQSLTTIGVVERVSQPTDIDGLIRLTAKRSVYSPEQLEGMIDSGSRPLKVIDFLLAGHLERPMPLDELVRLGVFNGHPPQSVSRLPSQRFDLLRSRLGFGFET